MLALTTHPHPAFQSVVAKIVPINLVVSDHVSIKTLNSPGGGRSMGHELYLLSPKGLVLLLRELTCEHARRPK
jgi:hypothetical protein